MGEMKRYRHTTLVIIIKRNSKVTYQAGPAIAIGELGDCLGRQMGWGRPLGSPLDLLPINHSENNKQIKTCLLIMIILGRPFSHTFTCQPDF